LKNLDSAETRIDSLVAEFTARAARLLGGRLKGVLITGSAARAQEFTPLSDVNIVVFASSLSPLEKLELTVMYSSRVFPVFLTVEDYVKLSEEGHLVAHSVYHDSKIVVADEEVARAVSIQPPITGRTFECLYKRSLACLSTAVRCFYLGLADSTAYLYRAVKNAAMHMLLGQEGRLVFSESELADLLRARAGEAAKVLEVLREYRVNVRQIDMEILEAAIRVVASLLRVSIPPWREVVGVLRERGVTHISDVSLSLDCGTAAWILLGLDERGEQRELRIGPGGKPPA